MPPSWRAERDAHERLTTEFKALSADALKQNNESLLKLAQATLENTRRARRATSPRASSRSRPSSNRSRSPLEKVDKKIGDIETQGAGDNAYGPLAERLKDLGTAQVPPHAEATKLSTALRSTTNAGTWGELQLRRVVEMADMRPTA